MKKNLFVYLCLFMSMFVLTACPSSDDDDDDTSPRTDNEKPLPVADELKPFVGYWEVTGSSYPHFEMFLYEDRKCWISKADALSDYIYKGQGLYEWNYNAATSVLSATNGYQWLINMVTDESWMGITVGEKRDVSYTAKKIHKSAYDILAFFILNKWRNVEDEEDEIIISPSSRELLFIFTNKAYYYNTNTKDRGLKISYSRNCVEEDTSSDKITIKISDYLNMEVIHPYNYTNSYIIIDAKLHGSEKSYDGSWNYVNVNIKGKYVRVLD